MIRVFCGDDTYESFISATSKLKEVSKNGKINIETIHGDEITDIGQIFSKVEGIGLFNETSILFIKRFFEKNDVTDQFIENFEKLDQFEIIIWLDKHLDQKKKLAKLLKKEKRQFLYTEQKSWQIEKWTNQLLNKYNIKLPQELVIQLVALSENNKWLIRSEILKFQKFAEKNNKSKLSIDEFENIIGLSAIGNIWSFLDSFGEKNLKKVLKESEVLLRYNDVSQYLIAMLNRELQILMDVKIIQNRGDDLKTLKLHPFVLQKSLKKATNFTINELQKLVDGLMHLDLRIKKGDINSATGIKLYLYGLEGKYYF
ncbi:hypothetical protein KC669_02320 [Candidatus Dojkabacteria bacterium]|uniref:DNA-directed DNA polymerase n=1 Tax=Candidatus Dojkabacteria bacterium TaxID=2099670 RepID=A0A955LB12_9BACT|nr:hypothetical protein [Candidatus Dojkabacteria bacterium]